MLLNDTMLDKGSRHTQLQRPATEGFKSPYLHVVTFSTLLVSVQLATQ